MPRIIDSERGFDVSSLWGLRVQVYACTLELIVRQPANFGMRVPIDDP